MQSTIASSHLPSLQRGATLLEALVAVLLVSLGLLALGGMMAYAIQIPQMAGNRSVAVDIGTELIERMRANVAAYNASTNAYTTSLIYNSDLNSDIPEFNDCIFPNCTASTLAAMDLAWAQRQIRLQLGAGGFSIEPATSTAPGRLWILWREVNTMGTALKGDLCPIAASSYITPQLRCLLIPYRL